MRCNFCRVFPAHPDTGSCGSINCMEAANKEGKRLRAEVRRLRAMIRHAIEDCPEDAGTKFTCKTCETLLEALRRKRGGR